MDLNYLDVKTRNMFLLKINEIISSVKVGDHVNLLHCVEEDWNSQSIDTDYIIHMRETGGYANLSPTDIKNFYTLYRDENGEDRKKVPALTKIYKCTSIVDSVPQLELVIPYSGVKSEKIDLMEHILDIGKKIDDIYFDDEVKEMAFRTKVMDMAVMPEKDYIDSIILDSEYVPYSSNKNEFLEFKKAMTEKVYNSPRRVSARKGAETRKKNKLIEEEMKQHLEQLKTTDLEFYNEIRG